MSEIKQLLLEAEAILTTAKIENPKLDAQLLLSEVLQISKPNLKMQEKEDSVQVGHGLSWTKTTCFRSEVLQIRTIH